MPSLRETTGSVILEALENGIPVVTANMFGARIILDDSCGYLYDWQDEMPAKQTLANAIEWCIQNKNNIAGMKSSCIEKASSLKFASKVKEYQTIYANLVESKII